MKERIKELRRSLGLTQEEFALRLGIKRGALANYEVGRNEPIDAVVALMCREFHVSEGWLRRGEGEMLVPAGENELLSRFLGEVAFEQDSFRKRILLGLSKLDAEDWTALENNFQKMEL